jgi:alkylation response protein AidB-like acyl-CoA dehydrogenase
MNFELTNDQQQIRDTFARFCDERIAPQAAALDEAKQYPRALFQELADLGFFGMRYPEEVGGSGTALTEFAWPCRKSRAARCRWPAPWPCNP